MSIDWGLIADIAGSICFAAGALLAFFAAIGVLRFPDIFARMHAATKPQVLGLFLVLVGIALILRQGTATWILLLVAVGQMLTAPVAAHMIGRASYRTGVVPKSEFTVDELTRDISAADAAFEARQRAHELGENEEAPHGGGA